LNSRYRSRDYATNVLSFRPAPDWPQIDGEPKPIGDVVICGSVVEREAFEQRKSPEAHWAHMVIHGALHLLGHDHETRTEAEVMEKLERELLAAFHFPDPYADEE
jgi:probable rRNA maturation factor